MTGRNIKKGSFKKGEDAVSPVIGVILMVAITVILAAVIGAFVFGMGSGVSKTYTVGVTARQVNSTAVDVTYQGGPDASSVSYMNVSINGIYFGTDGGVSEDSNMTLQGNVGEMVTCADAGITSGQNHVIVVAAFLDGSQQVVLDTYV